MEIYIAIAVTVLIVIGVIIELSVYRVFNYIELIIHKIDYLEHDLRLKLNRIENKD